MTSSARAAGTYWLSENQRDKLWANLPQLHGDGWMETSH